MAIAVVCFFSGSQLYETADEESAVVGSRKLDHTKQLSFLDKAAVETPSDHVKCSFNAWRLCTVTQVEEFKSLVRLLPIWATGIIFSSVYSQMGTLFALQGNTMELVRFREVKKHNYNELKHIQVSIFRHVPQYFIVGCAEVFTFVGPLDFFYEQACDAMRSLCSVLSLTAAAWGNYLSILLVNIVTNLSTRHGNPGWIQDNLNYGHLHNFFWLLALLSVLNLGDYLMVARLYTYKKSLVSTH